MRFDRPSRDEVRRRPDAPLVMDFNGNLRHNGPHIHRNPTYWRPGPDGMPIEVPADTAQPMGFGVGATPTVVTPAIPADIGASQNVTGRALWGDDADEAVDQGQNAFCYGLAPVDSLLGEKPGYIKSTDIFNRLADGRFVVTFRRNLNAPVSVVIDGTISASCSHTTARNGACALGIFERAYAFYRTGANTYASINWGWPGTVMTDLGMSNIALYPPQATCQTAMMTALAGDSVVVACTKGTCPSGLMIGSHCYRVLTVLEDGTVVLRNVWGFDGAKASGDPSDGIVTLTWAQFAGDVSAVAVSTGFATDVKLWAPTTPSPTPPPAPPAPSPTPSPSPTPEKPMQVTVMNNGQVIPLIFSIPLKATLNGDLAECRLTWSTDSGVTVTLTGSQFQRPDQSTILTTGNLTTNFTAPCTLRLAFTKPGEDPIVYTVSVAKDAAPDVTPDTKPTTPAPIATWDEYPDGTMKKRKA